MNKILNYFKQLFTKNGCVITDDVRKCWYQDGKPHRMDGPASEFSDGDKYWFINGVEYTEEQYREYLLIYQLAGLND